VGVCLAPKHDLLTVKETAAMLRVTPHTIYQYTRKRCKKPFPAIRVGSALRLPRRKVLEWFGLTEGDI
jgi:excisionase family DNA binding protein